MNLRQRDIDIPQMGDAGSTIRHFERQMNTRMRDGEIPVRIAVTETADRKHQCEIGVLSGLDDQGDFASIFDFAPRLYENSRQFNAVLLIPTGIGAELGGHSGDGGALARFIASACDKLVTHPNVVNASDINEMPENCLYVEGSVLASLLMGTVGLQEVRANRILLILDKTDDNQITELSINTASAARAAMGIDIPLVVEMEQTIEMEAKYSASGCAVGRIEALENICDIIKRYEGQFDAVALHTGIEVPPEFHREYLLSRGEMVNPWGGVEAMLTHALTMMYGVPTAHAPMVKSMEIANLHAGVTDPRIAAEAISSTFLVSVLKGLHRSPRIIRNREAFAHHSILTNADVSCLVIPDGCVGLPTLAAMEQGIPVIAVRENRNRMKNSLADFPFKTGKLFIVDNYLEAVGVMNALKAGVSIKSVRRPMADTRFITSRSENHAPVCATEEPTKVIKLHRE